MASAYTLAAQELLHIREKNQSEMQQRLAKVRSLSPDFIRTERELAKCGTALARCVLDGSEGLYDIEQKVKLLQKSKTDILKSLNLPTDYLDEIYSCPLCHDTGYAENGSRCECLRKLVTKNIGSNANLTEYMRNQTFRNFDFSMFSSEPDENGRKPLMYIKHAYASALRFAETFDTTHTGLLLMGNAGTGKTYLSSCIANYVLARGKTVYYQSSFRLFDILEKLKFGRFDADEQPTYQEVYDYIYNADLLIIDDLGTEFISAYSTAALFDIVNNRQLEGKSTILSTNLNSEALEQLYSNRLTSRLWGNFEIIPFIGSDLRLKKHEV